MKKITKSEFACSITLISVLACTAVHFLLITLNLFGVTKFSLPAGFSYIFAYILIAACLTLYILGFFVARIKRMILPAWLRIMFYIAFFLFTNTYYICGFYQDLIGIVIFFIYLTFLINILSVSIFYNIQKDDKNRLKASNKYITASVFCYSLAFSTLLHLAVSAVKLIFFKDYALSDLSTYFVEIVTMVATTGIVSVAFWLSLNRTKKFINSCLVKFTMRVAVSKTVKKIEEQPVEQTSKKASKPAKVENDEPQADAKQ